MKFTVRFAHLDTPSPLRVGDTVSKGDQIGRMGSTGSSNAPHVHMDLRRGFIKSPYRLRQIKFDTKTIKYLGYFIDKDFFKTKELITSSFGDPHYYDRDGGWKMHPGFDLVPLNRHKTTDNYGFFWNITPKGTVLAIDHNSDYGNYMHIGFER